MSTLTFEQQSAAKPEAPGESVTPRRDNETAPAPPQAQSLAGIPIGPDKFAAPPTSPIITDALAQGRALDGRLSRHFEPHLGMLDGVRIHDDARAHRAAAFVGARAFTIGRDIVFGARQYAPSTGEGQRLLGHELLHVAAGDAGLCRDPLTIEDIDAMIAENERLAMAATSPAEAAALFDERQNLLAQRKLAPHKKAPAPPAVAPDWALALSAKKKPFPDTWSDDPFKKKKSPTFDVDAQPSLSGGASIAASGVSMEKSAKITHWKSEADLVRFMDEYIAYCKDRPERKQQYEEAVAARPGLLAPYHSDMSGVIAAIDDYEKVHPEKKFAFDVSQKVEADKKKKDKIAAELGETPKLSGGAAAAASGQSMEAALNLDKTHWPEPQLLQFMEEYISYAKGNASLKKQYDDAVAWRTAHLTAIEQQQAFEAFQAAIDQIEAEKYMASGAEYGKLQAFRAEAPAPVMAGAMLGAPISIETYETVGTVSDAALKFVPILGEGLMAIEAARGKTLIMNENVSDDERIMDVILVGISVAGDLIKAGRAGAQVATKIAARTGMSLRTVGARLVLLHALETEVPALTSALSAMKAGRPLTTIEVSAVARLEKTLGNPSAPFAKWITGTEKAAAAESKITVTLGASANTALPKGMSLGEAAEASALRASRPDATLLGEKAGAYDATQGGQKILNSEVHTVDKAGNPIIVRDVTIRAPNDAIQIKTLSMVDKYGQPVKTPVEQLVGDNVKQAIDKAYNPPLTAARARTPLPGTSIYERANVDLPKKITIIVQVPGPVTEEMLAAARKAVADHGATAELPPIEVIVQTIQKF